MNQQTTKKNVVLKREKGGLIVSLLSAALFMGLDGLFIYLLSIWGPDALAYLFVVMFSVWLLLFLYAAILNLSQPKITITQHGEILIGDKKEPINAANLNIERYKERFSGGRVIIMILLGIIPCALFFTSLGTNKLILTYNGLRYTFRGYKESNFKNLEAYLNQIKHTQYNLSQN